MILFLFGPVPQHALQDEDIAKVDTFKEYNVQIFLDNFDFHMLGYFLKLLWLHYQPEIPSWVLDMHLMYVKDKEPGNAKTREKRARMYSPEGLCMQLENVNLPFGDYAPSAFGKIIEDQFNECFGKDLLNGKATLVFKSAENARIMLFKSLLHGSVHPTKHSAVSHPFRKWWPKGFQSDLKLVEPQLLENPTIIDLLKGAGESKRARLQTGHQMKTVRFT